MTIEEALNRYLVQLQADGRSPHTIGQYRRHIGLLARWARDVRPGRARIEDIDHEAVAAFLTSPAATSRAGNGKAKLATSANCLRSSVRGFFRYLHCAGHLREDPSRLVRRAITSPPPPKGLTAHEEGGLLDVLRAGIGFDAERDWEELQRSVEEFDELWEELFPGERARMLGLLVERVEYEARVEGVGLKFRVEAPTA